MGTHVNIPLSDYTGTLPILALTAVSLVALTVVAVSRKSGKTCFNLSVIGVLACIGVSLSTFDLHGAAFNGMVMVGGYASYFETLFLIAALLTILLSRSYLEEEDVHHGEYYLLILFATIGIMLIAAGLDLIITFLGLELMSICLYTLAGYFRKRAKSNESALKYFLLGAFATGFFLYGIALVYGASGTTNLEMIADQFESLSTVTMFWIGVGFLVIGFSFKVGAVPFHMWVPDVYEGSPTTVSGFMSTGAKAAGFAAFVLVTSHSIMDGGEKLSSIIAVLAAASMILGNVVAISQNNLKRLLAYSSIAHAGYMLIGLAAGNALGRSGILYYLAVYTFMNIGAFGILSVFEKQEDKNLTFEDYGGLGFRRPYLAALMSIFMFSLSGIPPFAGFFGKYYIFVSAIQADLVWLAIVGVLTSLVSVYYYLRLVVFMYFRQGEAVLTSRVSKLSILALTIAAASVIHLGVFPSTLLELTEKLF